MTNIHSKRDSGEEINVLKAFASTYSRDVNTFRVADLPVEYVKNLRSQYYSFSNIFEGVESGASREIFLSSDQVDTELVLTISVSVEARTRVTLFEDPDVTDTGGESTVARTLNRSEPDTVADGDYVFLDPVVDGEGVLLQERMVGGDRPGQQSVGGNTSPVASYVLDRDKDYLVVLENTSDGSGNISFVGDVIGVNTDFINDIEP